MPTLAVLRTSDQDALGSDRRPCRMVERPEVGCTIGRRLSISFMPARGTEAMPRTAILTFEGRTIELPVIEGSEGELAMDITKLRAKAGLITLDPGFGNTGACTSAITFIDGEKGILRYRGIPIEQLAERSNFIETAWLLIFGRLPTQAELRPLQRAADPPRPAARGVQAPLRGLPRRRPADGHALGDGQHPLLLPRRSTRRSTSEEVYEEAARLISKVRTIAAYSYRRSLGLPFIYPDPKLRYVANFLHMMFSMPYAQHDGRPGGRRGAEPDPAPARRPRAELQHLDGAGRRLEQGEPVRLVRRRRRRPVGAAARRGQRRGARDARGDPQGRDDGRAGARAGQGQDQRVPPDGLRPPGLQELRPPGRRSSSGRPTRCSASSASRTPCWTSPAGWRSWRWRTRTSSTGSSTRTSTSTAAS